VVNLFLYPEIREIRGFIWDKLGVILDNVGVSNVTHWHPKNLTKAAKNSLSTFFR
jgi:hypothetical protein